MTAVFAYLVRLSAAELRLELDAYLDPGGNRVQDAWQRQPFPFAFCVSGTS